MRRRSGWNSAAMARVAPATAQLGRSPADSAEPLTQHQDHCGVAEAKHGGEQGIGQGAVDDPVNVIEPVAKDRQADSYRDADRDTGKGNHEQQAANDGRGIVGIGDRQEPGGAGQPAASGHKRQPLQLLALDGVGPPSTHKRRQSAADRPNKQREKDQDGRGVAERVDGRIVKGGHRGGVGVVNALRSIGFGASITQTVTPATVTPSSQGTARQRRDGTRPSGNSNNSSASAGKFNRKVQEASQASQAAAAATRARSQSP
jgi:hypothetical protein